MVQDLLGSYSSPRAVSSWLRLFSTVGWLRALRSMRHWGQERASIEGQHLLQAASTGLRGQASLLPIDIRLAYNALGAAFLNEKASFASWSRSINQMQFIPRKQVSGLHLIKLCFQSRGSFLLLQYTPAAGSYQAVGHNGVRPRWHAANPNEPRRMTSTGLADYCVILLGLSGTNALFYYSRRKGVEVEGNGKRPAARCMYG